MIVSFQCVKLHRFKGIVCSETPPLAAPERT